jgi:acyl carrier protein
MSSLETNQVVSLLQEITGNSALSENSALLAEGLIDSFDIITLVDRLEEVFGVIIAAQEIVPENFGTVSDIVRMVLANRSS